VGSGSGCGVCVCVHVLETCMMCCEHGARNEREEGRERRVMMTRMVGTDGRQDRIFVL
jgi:hypothetical protein